MASLSHYLEKKILDHVLMGTVYTPPATVYLALFNGTITADGIGLTSEVPTTGGTGYTRKAFTVSPADLNGQDNVNTTNPEDIQFPVADTTGWGTLTFGAIMDDDGSAEHTGNMLLFGALTADKNIGSGDQFEILTNNLTVTLS